MIRHIIIVVLVMLGIASCRAAQPYDLTPQQFKERIANDSNAVVLDVRTPEEYQAGHLQNAVNLDYNNPETFTMGCESLEPSKTYYVYCRSGRRSDAACRQLQTYGLNVYNMCGGMQEWTKCGYPVVK